VTEPTVNLVEIFASAQGEGPYVGRSTVFVRFGECDLRCRWCDSPGTWRPARRCRIASPTGGPDRAVDDPLTLDAVMQAILDFEPAPRSFVSLTGGEPLLQPDACARLAARVREAGLQVHLETHGLAVAALERVIEHVDVVSMDWKLPSDVEPADPLADRSFDARHRAFLAVAARAPAAYVKVVLTDATRDEELDAVCAGIRAAAPRVPLILQPVTPFGRVRSRPDAARLLAWLRRCERQVGDVRLIPQTHPLYGAR
jgi:organic radical activating enzyme